MSDAIIAKALNSTIGTENFVGLDEILDSHLNKLDVILRQHAEDTKEALDALYNISNPVFSAKAGDPTIAKISASVLVGSSSYTYSKYLVLPYGGFLHFTVTESEEGDNYYWQYDFDGEGILSKTYNEIVFSPGARIRIRARAISDDASGNYYTSFDVSFRGHTEYAPEIKYTIE